MTCDRFSHCETTFLVLIFFCALQHLSFPHYENDISAGKICLGWSRSGTAPMRPQARRRRKIECRHGPPAPGKYTRGQGSEKMGRQGSARWAAMTSLPRPVVDMWRARCRSPASAKPGRSAADLFGKNFPAVADAAPVLAQGQGLAGLAAADLHVDDAHFALRILPGIDRQVLHANVGDAEELQ